MTIKNKVENILIKKYFQELSDMNMYWNKRSDEVLVYAKANADFNNINIKILVDTLLKMDNETIFYFMCSSFNINLIKKLILNGFSVYTQKNYINKYNKIWYWDEKYDNKKYVYSKLMLLGIVYNRHTILYFNNLHEPKRILKHLNKYELKIDTDFEKIVYKCSEKHGEKWLTLKMRNIYKLLYKENEPNLKFVSFALYRDGELRAGEFGCIIGKIYISYSGYHQESSAGTIQLLKMFKYLKEKEFICCDLGPSSDNIKYKYKYRFGAIDINRDEYFKLFNENKL